MSGVRYDPQLVGALYQQAAAHVAAASAGATGKTRRASGASGASAPPAPTAALDDDGDMFAAPLPPLPKIDMAKLTALVRELELDTLDKEIAGGEKDAQNDKTRAKASSDEKIDGMKKAEAEAKQKAESNLIMKIFGWIATALAVIVATVVAVVSFGGASALVGVAALTGAAISVTVSTLEETGAMDKIVGALADSLAQSLSGMTDPETAKLVGQIMAQVIVSAVIITTQLALAVFSGGSGAVASIASRAARIAAQLAIKGGMIAVAAIDVAGAGAQVSSSVYGYEEANSRADIELSEAHMKRIEALMEANQDALEEAVQKLQDALTGVVNMQRDHNQANVQIISNMSRQSV